MIFLKLVALVFVFMGTHFFFQRLFSPRDYRSDEVDILATVVGFFAAMLLFGSGPQ